MEVNTLGDRVKALRKAKGWKVEKLAVESDTSKSYISLLETNQRSKEPSAYKLQAVADALGTTLDYLVTGTQFFDKLDQDLKEIFIELLDQGNQGNIPFFRKSGQFDEEGLKAILGFIKFTKQESAKKTK